MNYIKEIIPWLSLIIITIGLTLSSILVEPTQAAALELKLYLTKESYNMGEEIKINGTLTLNGAPLSDALVSIQINEPDNTLWLIRTLPTGTNATTKQWPLQIIEVKPHPSQYFRKRDLLGLNITIRNNDLFQDHTTLIVMTLCHESGVPYETKVIANTTIPANRTVLRSFQDIMTIEQTFPSGNYIVYVNLLKDLPSNGGYAWGLEGKTIISVESTAISQATTISQTEGSYSLTFKTKDMYAMLGNYSITALTYYVSIDPPFAGASYNSTKFELILKGDLTGPDGVPDGKVDIRDITLVAYSFGSSPGDPRWNPIADLYPDNKINIRDIATVAANYGKIGIPPPEE